MLHRWHLLPDEVMRKPPGVRAFLFASMEVELEEEQRIRSQAERGVSGHGRRPAD